MISVSIKVDPHILITSPERVIQLFSFKVCEKREQHLQQYIGNHIKFKDLKTQCIKSGNLKKVRSGQCYFEKTGKEYIVDIDDVRWDTL